MGARLVFRRLKIAQGLEGKIRLGPEIIDAPFKTEACSADRAAFIECENLRILITVKLRRDEREKHRFPGAGWPDDQRVTDIANMGR